MFDRPCTWLPGEPMVIIMPETSDGAAEVHLELGGKSKLCRVVSDDRSLAIALAEFEHVIKCAALD